MDVPPAEEQVKPKTESEREKLIEEREKTTHNARVELAFTFVWMTCLAAKLWWLK